MSPLYLNEFSALHNNVDIIFCKTDFLIEEFSAIQKRKIDTILISGNSDYGIDDRVCSLVPKNVIRWYAQNALSVSCDKLHPIPLGLENLNVSYREGHGIAYPERAALKEQLIRYNRHISLQWPDASPEKDIYANFNTSTNPEHRINLRDMIQNIDYIEWGNPDRSFQDHSAISFFFDKIMDYKMVLCPIGNGIDTHRLWEVLYCNRIPIIIKAGNYKIYELYEKLPIIILDSQQDLLDYNLIMKQYADCKSKPFDKSLLDMDYWIEGIRKSSYRDR